MNRTFLTLLVFFISATAMAQTAVVDVSLSPAGSFKVNISDVKGFAEKKGDGFTAKDIAVPLKNLRTGIELRDTHTKKNLEVEKFPEAILVSATGKAGKGEGTIRIKDVQKKIEGTYSVADGMLTAQFKLNYQDFKIQKAKYMGVGVKDTIQLTITVPVKKSK